MFKRSHQLEERNAARGKVIQFESGDHGSGCADCKNNKGFELHHSLVETFEKGDVVVFAGAGVSTEGAGITNRTFF